jgi:hypothetical protein
VDCCYWLQAAAQEAVWAQKMATSEGRADNAEGMATAMNVSVRQLEAQLELRQQEIAAREGKSWAGLTQSVLLGHCAT